MTQIETTPRPLTEVTRDRLREMILSGEISAGARLAESHLAKALGVSRTPVREAISQLEAEGLVGRHAGVPQVSRLTVDDVMDILHVRLLLETDAARRAATVAPKTSIFLDLRQRFREFLAGAPPSPAAHFEADQDLHTAVVEAAGSPLVLDIVTGLKSRTRMFGQRSIPERFEAGCREHLAIVDAILDRDPVAAGEAMQSHINNARGAILDHLARR
ncbi:GntR family transcriptional regulator [Paracoccus suum]|uniref:GntR family transcriptional regulator n=1 Tax=Paracoccus suum TaxID=2259340 RepID=A0A344PPI8_9RHOB|nr:GntR family transcriptional regulator [Paracoccus suum]AXC51293.1 GntR family transcriptional regulator [Paracoccus suum]